MIILISGKPNSGKTHCMNYLKKNYNNVFIVDEYIHSIYKNNQIGYKLIKDNFGNEFINEIEVNRITLKTAILNDENMRIKLCNLIWPIIRNKLVEIKKSETNWIVEMAIYDIDNHNYFENIFDLTIEIKSIFIIDNEKKEFNKLYSNACKTYDYSITNKNNNQYIYEIIEIIEHYFSWECSEFWIKSHFSD